ncbi:DNA polymerase III PolC-type [Corynebacterium capitovis DSM 44611]|uniref:exonuclease domain-containing protein n=1 Tax=Corynebacterium capitovis TaxID=131081 RepID=UPI00037C4353|nr:exonuclease domain-containing protein [Corynebacterium capitovis]WKD57007.1 DNA polymerase III PolC-type [Corynebacterium capitovis DSM 44611]
MTTRPGFAVVDLETTGFGGTDRIIDIGVVLLGPDLEHQGTWETLVQPGRDIPNSYVHKITATDLVRAPRFEVVAPYLAYLLHGRIPVAHNAGFEKRFLSLEFRRAGIDTNVGSIDWLDTMVLSQRHLGQAKLSEALTAVGIENFQPHAALADAEATADLLRTLVQKRGASVLLGARASAEPNDPREVPTVVRGKKEDEHWLARLTSALPNQGDSNVDRYRRALTASLADLQLSASEIKHLGDIAISDGLALDDIAATHEEFIRQMAVQAWLDGVVTDEERAQLADLAEQLGVAGNVVESFLTAPVAGNPIEELVLRHGDRVAFTGALDLPREEWERRVTDLGLVFGGVTKKTVVLVAANPDSMSGKAVKARELLVPVIDERTFARLISALDPAPASAVAPDEELAERFPWVADAPVPLTAADALASHWIAHSPDLSLHLMSSYLDRDLVIDVRNSAVEKPGLRWQERFPRMLDATVYDLRDIPGVGEKRLRQLVEAVVLAALDADITGEYVDTDIYIDDADPSDIVAGWAALAGAPFPGTTEETIAVLFSTCTQELLDATTHDPRRVAIATRRWLGGATLDELGTQFGVSRERIRQLETQLRASFAEHSELSAAVAQQVARRVGKLAAVDVVKRQMPWLWTVDESLGCTYEEYFRGLFGLWKVDGGWMLAADFDPESGITLDAHGVFSVGELARSVNADESALADWLAQRGYLALSGGTMARVRSHQDRAVAVLSVAGEPLTVEEIAAQVEANPRSLANQMNEDPRISRVANGTYALTSWGLEPFTTITDWIGRRIDATGSVALADLLAEAPRLRISESSVRAYAAGSGFSLIDGTVTRSTTTTEIIDDEPFDSKNMYFRDGAWHLLLVLTPDHLRGSGFVVPRGVAGLYRVPVGGEVAVPSRLGDQYVRVNRLKQFSVSTIRRFLEELGSQVGDRVWLRFRPDAFDVVPAPPLDPSLTGLAGLLSEMGLDPSLTGESALAAINDALGLDASAPRRRAVALCGHRQQDDLADVIREMQV